MSQKDRIVEALQVFSEDLKAVEEAIGREPHWVGGIRDMLADIQTRVTNVEQYMSVVREMAARAIAKGEANQRDAERLEAQVIVIDAHLSALRKAGTNGHA